jgi:hypothetical protein
MQIPPPFLMPASSGSLDAFSARPDSPVVPHVERTSPVNRLRCAVADYFVAAARVISPARPVSNHGRGVDRANVVPCRG